MALKSHKIIKFHICDEDLFLSNLMKYKILGFCGSCGKRASDKDKFCTACGESISEPQVTVLEDVGEIIKEEYRTNQAPPDAELTSGEFIGDQKRAGEWLEATVEHILRFAGFETKRQAPFVFNDSTGDKFVIDVLAKDQNIEIFVECKDLHDLKMDEKIMYTVIGQVSDYRKRQTKKVIGIIAMTARDDGRNTGIMEKLKKENSFLWDGSFIENLKNKMVEIGNKDDFRRYVLDHLDVFETPAKKDNEGYDFMVKYSFFTVSPDKYVGKAFDVMNIIDGIRDKIGKRPIRIINHKFEYIKSENKRIISCHIVVDFSMTLSKKEIIDYADRNKGFMDRIFRRGPVEITYRKFKDEIHSILEDVYGIRYDSKSKSEFDQIRFEGSRVT